MGKQLRLPIVMGSIALLVVFIALVVTGYWFRWGWTGFPTKTLWDWLNLLGVLAIPMVVGFGAVWYTARQTKASEAAAEQQRKTEIEMAEQRHKIELEIAEDNQRETALQAYIDKMSEMLLEKNLRQSAMGDEVREVARVRTLTVLKRLDSKRQGSVLQFLWGARLIDKSKGRFDTQTQKIIHTHECIIKLRGADLNKAELSEAELSGAELVGVNLKGANLRRIDLQKADLAGVNLRGANLQGAILYKTNLSGANLSGADLSGAMLEEAILCFAILNNANLSEANLQGAIVGDTDLSGAVGVTNEQLSKANPIHMGDDAFRSILAEEEPLTLVFPAEPEEEGEG